MPARCSLHYPVSAALCVGAVGSSTASAAARIRRPAHPTSSAEHSCDWELHSVLIWVPVVL